MLREATSSAEITHNHPEGIKGAQAVALAVFLARTGVTREGLRAEIHSAFGYDLDRTVDALRPHYAFDSSCQGSVPEAIVAFLDSTSWQDAVRSAVSPGGDSDTLACITGAIAEAFYGPVPEPVSSQVQALLTSDLWDVTSRFRAQYVTGRLSRRE